MPRLATLILVSLPTLAMVGCNSAKNAAELAKVQQLAQRAADVQEIQNVMSRRAYYSATGQYERELKELWDITTTQNASFANEKGYWVEAGDIRKYYVTYQSAHRAKEPTTTIWQPVSTPVIEVADDGYTAKGVWYSMGQVMRNVGGKATPSYIAQRYYVDFYRANTRWKIWHFIARTEWSMDGQNWVAGPAAASDDVPVPSERIRPEQAGEPNIPEPYKNFSLTFSYGPPRHV